MVIKEEKKDYLDSVFSQYLANKNLEITRKLYFVEGFAMDARPYYGFNYFEESEGKTNIIHIHRNHPVFQKVGFPNKSEKFILTAKLGQKLKRGASINIYIYEPSDEIKDLKRVNQCYICLLMIRKDDSWENCCCSCKRDNFNKKHLCHKKN